MQLRKTAAVTDIGDYLKVAACTAVMAQTVLGLALATRPGAAAQWAIGQAYDLVKFTAPAFIFGILYTTLRQHAMTPVTKRQYWRQQWAALGVPSVWWTLVYLIITPKLQQHQPFHDLGSFLWQAVNGNAAPHLWYNTMMLQFIVVMPLFWAWSAWVGSSRYRAQLSVGAVAIFYALWLAWFPHAPTYLVDRLALSFLPYAVLGVLWWQFPRVAVALRHHWLVGLLWWALGFMWLGWQLKRRGLPVSLPATGYYQPSALMYALGVIGLVSCLAVAQLQRRSTWLPVIHWLATYAYRAYLSHAFWLYWLWPLTDGLALGWRILLSYGATWIVAFATTYCLHWGWQRVKMTTQ
ncbi:acyltransferase family protein [Levilactobacillus suantsaii]|uniref:Acyltransferase n=1 Tax=Levilactobacillus suantsaii TaxID=2292255 RepID=A0A4Q0VII6_9LACO|nr:acyltransferase [Levilactobacillus suantsaii]QMU07442.1 acyltransferase [Levilactobacillus suantsaii]RXI79244.1 acyltransferase [Levilactobacillus suantsaii]